MSVVGLVPIASFESWDGEQYQTTQIAIWTAKEEKRTRDLYAGFDVKFDPGESSLKDFIKNTDWSTAQGARKFFDDQNCTSIPNIFKKGNCFGSEKIIDEINKSYL